MADMFVSDNWVIIIMIIVIGIYKAPLPKVCPREL